MKKYRTIYDEVIPEKGFNKDDLRAGMKPGVPYEVTDSGDSNKSQLVLINPNGLFKNGYKAFFSDFQVSEEFTIEEHPEQFL